MRASSLSRARQLRRNQTRTELQPWMRLRGRQLGAKFRRQYRIGPYIVDFCCLERRLVIELDGGQHSEQMEADGNEPPTSRVVDFAFCASGTIGC
jgi:very-short-patch-repair endonuclease